MEYRVLDLLLILCSCNPQVVVAKIKQRLWRLIVKQDSMQKHNWVTVEDA